METIRALEPLSAMNLHRVSAAPRGVNEGSDPLIGKSVFLPQGSGFIHNKGLSVGMGLIGTASDQPPLQSVLMDSIASFSNEWSALRAALERRVGGRGHSSELFQLQIRANSLHQQVEITSRVGESVHESLRRLQQSAAS